MASDKQHRVLAFENFYNLINNELKSTPKTRHGIDPSTASALPPVPVSTLSDVDAAVAAARAAFKPWSRTPIDERQRLVEKFADAIEANGPLIQEWLSYESGKPHQTAAIEVGLALGLLRGQAAIRIPEDVVEDNEDRRASVRYVPLGVCAALVPWNWPLVLGVGKISPALVQGNTLIFKPSPFTPYVALKLGELARDIFPPGVLQFLSGGDDLGPMLTEHEGIDKISFTGSTATGKKVMASCAKTLKRVMLELGGNDAAIVCEDADLDKAVPKIAAMTFMSSGQICMNVKRIYIHSSIYEDVKNRLVAFVENAKVGKAIDPEVFIGPVQNRMQYDKLTALYAEIGKQGWKTAVGGTTKAIGSGFFFEPTIIDNPPEDSAIVQQEPFGPIVPILKWDDEEDVISRANATKDGLGASVWTSDIERGIRIRDQLEAGSVWLNTHFELSPTMPFGGHKWSGIGMEWGSVGAKGWCNPQAVWWRKKL